MGSTITRKPDREEKLIFTEPFMHVHKVMVTQRNTADSHLNVDSLYGKTVAVENGFTTMKQLQEMHPRIILKPVASTLDALKEVSWGNADAYVGNQAVAHWLIRENQLSNLIFSGDSGFGKSPQNHAVSKSDPEWKPLAALMEKALASIGDLERREIEYRWLGIRQADRQEDKTKIALTQEEQQWLQAHADLRLGVDPLWPPVEYFDRDGKTYLRMASDVVGLITKRLNINMTVTAGLSWPEVHERTKNGVIDLLPAVTKANLRSEYLNFTRPYLVFPLVIFTRDDADFFLNDLGDLRGKRVVVEEGYVTENRLARDYPYLHMVKVSNTVEALQELSSGKVDAYVGNLTIG